MPTTPAPEVPPKAEFKSFVSVNLEAAGNDPRWTATFNEVLQAQVRAKDDSGHEALPHFGKPVSL